MDNYNYPPGADTPDAPWNQPSDEEITRFVSVSLSFDITDEFPVGADEEYIKYNLKDTVRNLLKDKLCSEVGDISIDELEIIKD